MSPGWSSSSVRCRGRHFLACAQIGIDGTLASFAAAQLLRVQRADDVPVPHHPGTRRELGRRVKTLFDQQRREVLLFLDRTQAFIHARHQLAPFPEAEPMLKALRQYFLLGVITNGNADVQRVGLADYFHFALRAEDIGIAKPDARLFQEALQRGGVDASAAVHIGDHPGDDIAGAQQAGLRAVWFNPTGKVWEADKRPDAEVRSLAELAPLLAGWK